MKSAIYAIQNISWNFSVPMSRWTLDNFNSLKFQQYKVSASPPKVFWRIPRRLVRTHINALPTLIPSGHILPPDDEASSGSNETHEIFRELWLFVKRSQPCGRSRHIVLIYQRALNVFLVVTRYLDVADSSGKSVRILPLCKFVAPTWLHDRSGLHWWSLRFLNYAESFRMDRFFLFVLQRALWWDWFQIYGILGRIHKFYNNVVNDYHETSRGCYIFHYFIYFLK